MSPSFPRSARAESKTESGIFTNILYPNSFVKDESISKSKYVNAVCTTCVTVH